MAIKIHPSFFNIHVGDWLRTEVVEPSGIKIAALARHLGVARQSVSDLLHGHSGMSAEMAIRFEKAFGVPADTLLRMQTNYELVQARAHEADIHVERIEMAAA
ncbi:HigA family addiction module antitoxin [Sphingomonadaceae bacterium G21617-S1]|nr:HigA family addiction module antitoxin [Sphingomonadaceae bacterium G21617-S1]